ncbi:MAG TPA: hypothetical protein VLH60_07985 [Sedimentisphaerales bacterium]|nr:hypothetical protein [Sedimentisphaerales bacterium]
MIKFIRKDVLIGAGAAFVVLCLVTAALYFLLVRPRNIELQSNQARAAAKQSELDSLSAEAIRRISEQAEHYRNRLSEYMALSGQQGELSIRLRQMAVENRVADFSGRDVSGRTMSDSALKYVDEQRMNITFAGDFGSFAGFLRAIESNRPVVLVDGFNVAHDSRDSRRITASMESTVYYERSGR